MTSYEIWNIESKIDVIKKEIAEIKEEIEYMKEMIKMIETAKEDDINE
jgi:archaellum component FlaC